MKNLKEALVLALIPFALTACGGGGGGDNAATDTPSTPTTPSIDMGNGQNYGLTDNEIQAMATLSNTDIRSTYGTFPKYVLTTTSSAVRSGGISRESTKLTYGSSAYKNQVTTESTLGTVFVPDKPEQARQIRGVDWYSDYRGYTSGRSFTDFSYFLHSDDSYGAVQFGIAKTADADGTIVGFFGGTPTPYNLLPQSGTFEYRGDLILFPDTLSAGSIPVGAMAANIDFGSKSAAMVFAAPNGYQESINAKVVGSMLGGRDGQKYVEGVFAGASGGELVGQYSDNAAGVFGVYGAKRQ